MVGNRTYEIKTANPSTINDVASALWRKYSGAKKVPFLGGWREDPTINRYMFAVYPPDITPAVLEISCSSGDYFSVGKNEQDKEDLGRRFLIKPGDSSDIDQERFRQAVEEVQEELGNKK